MRMRKQYIFYYNKALHAFRVLLARKDAAKINWANYSLFFLLSIFFTRTSLLYI